ncbi:MAG: toll/interleukin-1 receptor domain-containing protein [Proteobacteria bacterium]|nr:toll/interleukin-1 receptor domain-containing protein [Pseudomonadota bacterium]
MTKAKSSVRRPIFLSYVREDSCYVDRICERLAECNIIYWLDRINIPPGKNWKRAIENAIEEGGLFVACFSDNYLARERSYMNEELWLAIKELRLRGFSHEWFLPIRLTDCLLPEVYIAADKKLRDIRTIDFYDDFAAGLDSLTQHIIDQVGCPHVWVKIKEKLMSTKDLYGESFGMLHSMKVISRQTYMINYQCSLCQDTKIEKKEEVFDHTEDSRYYEYQH